MPDEAAATVAAAPSTDTKTIAGRLTTGAVHRHLTGMTVPMAAGILAVIGFNVVDTFFVAQLGTEQLAALSFTFPVVMVVTSLAIGLGAGSGSVVARAIGTGDRESVCRLATDALFLAVLLVAVLVTIGQLTLAPLFTLLGAPEELLPQIAGYMRIWYVSIVFIVVPMVGNALIRATGDARIPGLIMIGAALLNGVLDPILIFGLFGAPRLEIQGAAIATMIAQAMTFVAALLVLIRREKLLTVAIPTRACVLASWRRILVIALPAAGTNAVNPLTIGVITVILSRFGPETVAAYGVVTRIEALALIPVLALSSVIGPFVGQNRGAGFHDRVLLSMRQCFMFSLAWGAGVAAVLAVFGHWIVPLFDDTPAVAETAILYLSIVPIGYAAYGMVMLCAAMGNGLGRPIPGAISNLLRSVGLYIPFALLGAMSAGPLGVFMAALMANLGAGAIAWWWATSIASEGTVGRRG